MKVTVMSPQVADAAGFRPSLANPHFEGRPTWTVLAPDGVFYGPHFAWASEFAYSYELPVSFL
jgi:hypothetical protein